MSHPPIVSFEQASQLIMAHCRTSQIETVKVEHSLGYVLAQDVVSQLDIPSFHNSAMDGFAVKYDDVKTASEDMPVYLSVTGVIAAGQAPIRQNMAKGTCYQIMTGAPVPRGADTIIPVEYSKLAAGSVIFDAPYGKNKHIRKKGTDFKRGAVLYQKGQKITAQMLPALCSIGSATVAVFKKPTVVWLSTGQELTDQMGDVLQDGKIFNTSGPYGEAAMPAFGADLKWRRTISDDLEAFRVCLVQADDENIDSIISTGAVSVGIYDFVRDELEKAGWHIILHRARVKPGKPILFAQKETSEGRKRFFFGLPGNPVSSAMGMRMFVYPFLRRMQGLTREKPFTAKLSHNLSASETLTVFFKAVVRVDHQGQMLVETLDDQQSYQIGALGHMNCWLIHPDGIANMYKGDRVYCLPFMPE